MFSSNKLNALFFRLENFRQEIPDKPGKEVINLRAEVKVKKKLPMENIDSLKILTKEINIWKD